MSWNRSLFLFFGILFLIQRGTCQLDIIGVDPITAAPIAVPSTVAATAAPTTAAISVAAVTTAAPTPAPATGPLIKVAATTPRPVAGTVTSGSFKNSIPKVQDQTNQTFTTLNQILSGMTIALANISTDAKDSLDEAIQNISKIVSTGAEFKRVENGVKSLSTVFKNLLVAADKRVDLGLVNLGKLLKTSIASIVKLERDNLGRMKLSSDEKTAAKNLRSFESGFYKNLSTCLSTFNGSMASDIGTVENALDTMISEGQSTVTDLAKAGCPSKECSSVLKDAATTVASWNTAIAGALNKIPVIAELTACIAGHTNLAKLEFATLSRNIAPPVDLRTVLTNNTDPLEAFVRSALSNFSTGYQKIIKPITNRINLLRTAVSRNALTDPKTIIANNFKPITNVDDSTVQLVNSFFPRITTLHRRAIVPLVNKDNAIQTRISQAIGKDTSPNGTVECDTAIQNITNIKSTFNSSVIACHLALQPAISTLLTDIVSSTNDTIALFNGQMDSVTRINTSALQQIASQLKTKLAAGSQLLTDMKKLVNDAVNKAYGTLEKCVNDAVKAAVDDLDEKDNPVIKSCLVI